jgi:hypothetical protein
VTKLIERYTRFKQFLRQISQDSFGIEGSVPGVDRIRGSMPLTNGSGS